MGVAAATRVVCLSVLCLCVGVRGFYIPGVAPTEYEEGDRLEIKAVKMTSIKTQLPYEYYSLPFCKPKDGDVHYKTLNLGEVLRGDRIVNTPYQLSVLKEEYCRILCETELNHKQVRAFSQRIDEDYTIHMLADNLPAATVFKNLKSGELQYEDGFKLGFSYTSHVVINNHLKIRIKYHTVPKPDTIVYRIVGFEVEPQSIHSSAVSKQPDDRCTINKDDLKVMELKNSNEFGDIVANIVEDCRGKTEKVIMEVLRRWLAGKGVEVSWESLIATLRDCELSLMADQIQMALDQLRS